jgi:hypothetical protein
MEHVFTFHRGDYAPMSFKNGNYFYESFDILSSFLSNRLENRDLERLLKPTIEDGDKVKWLSNKPGQLNRISELPAETSNKILIEFHDFLKRVEAVSGPLKTNKDNDQREWGEMIDELFQPEKIILVGNSAGDWAMLWGWNFRNKEENKLPQLPKSEPVNNIVVPENPPIIPPEPIIVNPTPPLNTTNPINPIIKNENVIPPPTDKPTPNVINNIINEAPLANKIGCFGRISRFLRWISYRFWALFWLIIYTLLIILLCRYFFRPDSDECCKQLENTVKELNRLEEAVRTRCDSTIIVR